MSSKQKAGKGSTQLNAGRDVIFNQSPSLSDVRDLVKSEIKLALTNYKADAIQKYVAKGESMIEKLFVAIGDDKSKLKAFSDPDFNFAILDAGRAIASNDGEYTEELLVEILADRAASGSSNRVKIVTKQAIQAADKLSGVTLNSLTNFWVMVSLGPVRSNFIRELEAFATACRRSFDALQPSSPSEWIEEAELLGLIEIDRGFGSETTKPFNELLGERFARYLRAGIPDDKWNDMNKTLIEHDQDIRINVVQHPLKKDFVLIDHDTKEHFLTAVEAAAKAKGPVSTIVNEMVAINKFDSKDAVAQEQLLKLIDANAHLKTASEWWQKLPSCRITTVGKAISYLHAKNHITFGGAENLEDYLSM